MRDPEEDETPPPNHPSVDVAATGLPIVFTAEPPPPDATKFYFCPLEANCGDLSDIAINIPEEPLGGYSKHTYVKKVKLLPATGTQPSTKIGNWKLRFPVTVTVGDAVSVWDGKNDIFVITMITIKKGGTKSKPSMSIMLRLLPSPDLHLAAAPIMHLPPVTAREKTQVAFTKSLSCRLETVTVFWAAMSQLMHDKETEDSAPALARQLISAERDAESRRHKRNSSSTVPTAEEEQKQEQQGTTVNPHQGRSPKAKAFKDGLLVTLFSSFHHSSFLPLPSKSDSKIKFT